MATKLGFIAVPAAVLLVSVLSAAAMAQSVSQCSSVLVTMSSCLNYVGGSAPAPSSSCCSALANVVQTQPRCLCLIVNGGGGLGVSINQTRALGLPKVCSVQTPPVSRCNEGNGPEMAPGGPPEASPPAGSETGSKTVPSNGSTPSINFAVFVANIITLLLFMTPAAFTNVF